MRLPPPPARREEPPEEELPRARVQPFEPAAADAQRDDVGAFQHDLLHAQPEHERAHERLRHPEDDEQRERGDEQRPPVVGGDRMHGQLVAGRDLVEPAQRDGGVGGEVHRVPPLVRQPPPHDHQRGDDDDDEQRRPDGGGDHPGIAAEQPRHFLRHRDPVHRRVADRDQHDVGEDQVEHELAVAPVPHRQPVEADEPLEPRQPGEQQHLDEREVGAEEPGDPAQAGGEIAPRVDGRDAAAAEPQPDDHGRVDPDHRPEERGEGDAARAAAPPERQRGGLLRHENDFGHSLESQQWNLKNM